jgi:hypothetical protein
VLWLVRVPGLLGDTHRNGTTISGTRCVAGTAWEIRPDRRRPSTIGAPNGAVAIGEVTQTALRKAVQAAIIRENVVSSRSMCISACWRPSRHPA